MNIANQLIDNIKRIQALKTPCDTLKYLEELANEHSLGRFALFTLSTEANTAAEVSVIKNYEPEFIEIYDEHELLKDSPISRHVRKHFTPLFFDMDALPQIRPPCKRDLSIALARDFGMRFGICYPLKGPDGQVGGLEFRSSVIELAEEDIFILHLLAQYTYDNHFASTETNLDTNPSLSTRERDCLSWIAAGKTSGEIASILNLSDNTIDKCVASACQKLDATSRLQAVAKAMRTGLIG